MPSARTVAVEAVQAAVINEIMAWVKQTGTVVNYGGSNVILYELSA
mgnify:CR=1 FL=1